MDTNKQHNINNTHTINRTHKQFLQISHKLRTNSHSDYTPSHRQPSIPATPNLPIQANMKLGASLLDVDAPNVPPSSATKRLLHASDTLFAMFVVAPLVVMHWRGTWALMDRWPLLFTPAKSMAFAMLLLCTIAMMRDFLFEQCSRRPGGDVTQVNGRGERLSRRLLIKVYAFVFGVGCNMQWHGSWAMLDALFGMTCETAVYEIVVCFAGLVMLCSVRNLAAPPGVVLTDSKDMSFRFPTRFRIKATDEPGLYILDCLFSVVVIGSLVVFVWRGVWLLCDLLIYPENFTRSSWASLFIGYGIVGASFCMQSTMRWLCEQLSGGPRLAAADIFLAFSFVGTVNVWRGVWNMCDLYFIPDDHKLAGDVITHAVPFLLLALLNCSNSVLVRGVYIDAEEPAGQCVVFPVYYVRLFFQKERTKKQKRAQQQLQQQHSGKTATTTLLPLLGSGNGGEDVEGCAGEALKANQKPTIVIVPTNHISAATNDDSGNNNDE